MQNKIMPRSNQILSHQIIYFISILLLLLFLSPCSASTSEPENSKVNNPAIDLWTSVRRNNEPGKVTSQINNVDSVVLINTQGENWTRFRMDLLIKYSAILLIGIASLILLFYLIKGKIKIEGGLSGRMVRRFTEYEVTLHWSLAIVFLFLAFTGMVILFGRPVLIPIMGHEFFAVLASASKQGHNLFGPIFLVTLILMLVSFVKRNIYARGDMTWLLKGGGFFSKEHVTGGFFNMGEKTWYWIVILIGLAISISGLILISPNFGQGRIIMELSHVVHGIGAIVLIAISLGHIYLSAFGTEGTLENMKTGYSDIKWVEEHHDRWAKECHENNLIISAEEYARIQGKTMPGSEVTATTDMQQQAVEENK